MKTRSGYWIGGGLIVVGVVGAILWAVVSLSSIADKVDGFARVPAGGSDTVRLEARKYVIYFEGPTADEFTPVIDVTVTDERGSSIPTPTYVTSLTYDFGGHEGSAGATVAPPREGRYRVRVSSADVGEADGVAIGESLSRPLVRTVAGTLGIAAIFGLAGIALLVTTIVRRYNARKAAAGPPPPPYGSPPPPYGQTPSPGDPPQPVPPQQPPPSPPSLWS